MYRANFDEKLDDEQQSMHQPPHHTNENIPEEEETLEMEDEILPGYPERKFGILDDNQDEPEDEYEEVLNEQPQDVAGDTEGRDYGAETEEKEIDYWTSEKGYTLEDTETGEVKQISWSEEYDEGIDSNDWYYALPTDSDGEEELVQLDYYDGYFYYQGEQIDVDVDDIVWKDEDDPEYGNESIEEELAFTEKEEPQAEQEEDLEEIVPTEN